MAAPPALLLAGMWEPSLQRFESYCSSDSDYWSRHMPLPDTQSNEWFRIAAVHAASRYLFVDCTKPMGRCERTWKYVLVHFAQVIWKGILKLQLLQDGPLIPSTKNSIRLKSRWPGRRQSLYFFLRFFLSLLVGTPRVLFPMPMRRRIDSCDTNVKDRRCSSRPKAMRNYTLTMIRFDLSTKCISTNSGVTILQFFSVELSCFVLW